MSTSSAQQHDSQGSFVTGFTVGMFAGAAGYFLFATKEGKSVRSELEQEWQSAKVHLAEKGVIEDKDLTLRQMVSGWFARRSEPEPETDPKSTPKSPKKKRTFRKAA